MRPFLLLVCALGLFTSPGRAQQLYFPPLTGSAWETISPSSLGWRTDQIDSLEHFLVQIYDMQGKRIRQMPGTNDIPAGDLPKGLYVVQARTEKGWHLARFVKE